MARLNIKPGICRLICAGFSTVATESGTLEFKWSGDNGFLATERSYIAVS